VITLALFAAPIAAPLPQMEPEIVVIGQRLQRVQVNIARDREGRLHCSLNGSSGNAKLDQRVCKASAKCVRKVGGKGQAAIHGCIVDGKAKLLAQFRDEWRRSRGK
jgi:hypothetical protein